jgi:hypothetical protein
LPRGPYRFVQYGTGAEAIDPVGSCGDVLVFGPLDRPGIFRVNETWIERLFWLRLVIGFLIMGGVILTICPSRLWRMSGQPRPG